MSGWTPQEVDCLKRLAAEGLTASRIADRLADEFGTRRSRNAIIGKLMRAKGQLGKLLTPATSDMARRAARRCPDAKPARPARQPRPVVADPPLPVRREEIPRPVVANLPATLPMAFLHAVERDRCLHYIGDPYGAGGPEMPVCGAERSQWQPGSRYCSRHEASSRGVAA